MIDIENEVFHPLATNLRSLFTGIYVTGEYRPTMPQFPAVSVEEADNSTRLSTVTAAGENHSDVMYEINVYSNLQNGRKTEAKQIANAIDAWMAERGFYRTFRQPIPNPNDTSIYRILIRYTGTVDKNKVIYRR